MDNGGIYDGAFLEDQPLPSQMRCAERKQLLRKVMLLQAMSEFAYRGFVWHAARRLHVNKKLLRGGIGTLPATGAYHSRGEGFRGFLNPVRIYLNFAPNCPTRISN